MIKKNIKNLIESLMSLLLKPFVVLWFWFLRWFRHNRLLAGLGNKEIGRHSVFYIPFAYISRFSSFLKATWNSEFAEYTLKKYKNFLKIHYSKDGLGYFDYDGLSESDCLKIYRDMESRIAYYIKHNSVCMGYENGDSFLDAGCGKGQSIKELVKYYPDSQIKGFDVNAGALRIIQIALKDKKNVKVEKGSVVDFKYLESYPAKSYDHLVVSHVFSFLTGSNIEETRKLRQVLIGHFIRIAAKSVLIMDGDILSERKEPEVIIEQNTRYFFRESLVSYFSKHALSGELYAMFSPENEAVIFKLKR
ncbi:MAG: class I SAM-dependent methyltransferase [Candidatus Gorgyraea atricola]|nr:class I SAM-dependent methyltransferase [Candidatus Gorgyraea atricola]